MARLLGTRDGGPHCQTWPGLRLSHLRINPWLAHRVLPLILAGVLGVVLQAGLPLAPPGAGTRTS